MLKVSIITVSFNSSKTIQKTLESVNQQSYADIEHLIIDGGSSDKTLDIVSKCKKRPGIIISETDKGIYDAMNKGLEMANGDIICFLNSDDCYYSQNSVAAITDEFVKHDLDVIYGDVIYEDFSGRKVRYYSSKKFSPLKLKFGFMPAHPSLFVRKNIYKQVGYYQPKYKIAGDFEMCCRLFQMPFLRTRYLAVPFVKMLTGGASSFSLSNVALVNREIREACLINGIYTNYPMILSRYLAKFKEFNKSKLK